MGLPRGSEWIIILIIVVLLFGPNRIGKIASELGKGIRNFRDGLSGPKDEQAEKPEDKKEEETK